jgi:hypothetical protein
MKSESKKAMLTRVMSPAATQAKICSNTTPHNHGFSSHRTVLVKEPYFYAPKFEQASPVHPQPQSPSVAMSAAGPIMPPTAYSLKEQPNSYRNQRVAKYFDDGILYFGYVKYYNSDTGLWRIFYDDTDREDYDALDMIKFGKEYEMHKHEDPSRSSRLGAVPEKQCSEQNVKLKASRN